MNVIWTLTTIAALVALTAVNPQAALTVCVDSGAQALTTALGLCGVYCLWMGIFQVAENCHLVEKLSACLAPLNKLLYGKISQVASNYISLNFASNLLGVGNAATPSAIAAVKETETTEKLSRTGAMLFVINASGVQLVPTTVIGLRASLGSSNPADILLPNLIATLVSALLGVALVILCYGLPNGKRNSETNVKGSKRSVKSFFVDFTRKNRRKNAAEKSHNDTTQTFSAKSHSGDVKE